jgi:hypothetical protein
MVVSTQSSSNMVVARSCVWLNYKSIQQAMEHMQILNIETEGMKWVKFDKKQQNDAISESVKQIVVSGGYLEEIRVSSNVKDVVHHLIFPNTWEKHVVHFL